MPKFVEELKFDKKLFDRSIGRIDLSEKDCKLLTEHPTIDDILGNAHSAGYNLIYIFSPPLTVTEAIRESKDYTQTKFTGRGEKVDVKFTYHTSIHKFDREAICAVAFHSPKHKNIRIRKYSSKVLEALPNGYDQLRALAVASGAYSRFNLDKGLSQEGFEGMFEAWLNNSLNKTMADAVFMACDADKNNEVVGLITVKRKDLNVNIGLLAVAESHRRMGIAQCLLSRAVLFALEEVGYSEAATLNVVTQGGNPPACQCYERFGFDLDTTQDVWHCWLPEHLKDVSCADKKNFIPFCKQHLSGQEIIEVTNLMSKSLDSTSNYNIQCSSEISSILGPDSSRVLLVPSGTAALEMAALLSDLGIGDEVIMPSYTFSSTANAFVLRGAIPVFIDVVLDTINMNEALIEQAITEKTKAICVVHYGGVACEMDTIMEIAARHKLIVIEDAAQAFLSSYKGRQLGTIGDFGCFSFHYTKNVICGEGGAISVNRSPERASRATNMWENGTNRYDFLMGKTDRYEWVDVGSAFVPSEVSCAILWSQLGEGQALIEKRLAHCRMYTEGLQPLVQKRLLQVGVVPDDCVGNGHIFFLILPSKEKREHLGKYLHGKGVAAFTHYAPLHCAPAGRKYGRVGSGSEDMSCTLAAAERLLRVPVWADLKSEQVSYIVQCVTECLEV